MKEKVALSLNFGELGVSPINAVKEAVSRLELAGYTPDTILAHASVAHGLLAGINTEHQFFLGPDKSDCNIHLSTQVTLVSHNDIPESVVLVKVKERETSETTEGISSFDLGDQEAVRVVHKDDAQLSFDGVLREVLQAVHPNLDRGTPNSLSPVQANIPIAGSQYTM
jgi:hypothetical protein